MRNLTQMFGDEPHRFIGGHPLAAVEAREIYRPRIAAKGAFKPQIEVDVKITHGQLAESAIDRFAILAACVV